MPVSRLSPVTTRPYDKLVLTLNCTHGRKHMCTIKRFITSAVAILSHCYIVVHNNIMRGIIDERRSVLVGCVSAI